MGTGGVVDFGAGTPVRLHRNEAATGLAALWPGSTVVCLACGPSLTPEDVELVRQAHAAGRVRVIAINAAIRLAPWADARYAYHAADWKRPEEREILANFNGLRFAVDGDAAKYGVTLLKIDNGGGLELTKPDTIKHGKNGGYQSINVAVRLGARRIILLGYDLKRSADDRLHFYPCKGRVGINDFKEWARYFETLPAALKSAGVEVVNATRDTALNVFPRVSLEEALA